MKNVIIKWACQLKFDRAIHFSSQTVREPQICSFDNKFTTITQYNSKNIETSIFQSEPANSDRGLSGHKLVGASNRYEIWRQVFVKNGGGAGVESYLKIALMLFFFISKTAVFPLLQRRHTDIYIIQ